MKSWSKDDFNYLRISRLAIGADDELFTVAGQGYLK